MPAQRLVINASDLDLIRSRQEAAYGAVLDEKRPRAWTEYGYPETVTIERLRGAYERGGAGHGAVHRLLDKCWQSWPRIKAPDADEEGPFEKKVADLFKKRRLWVKLKDFDRRNLIGRYAGLIYRVADGRKVDQPLGRGELVDVIPVFEDQLEVTEWYNDLNSDGYGKPRMFRYRTRNPAAPNDQANPAHWEHVHPSRVQILAEGSVGDDFTEGIPLLKAGLNALIDLEKISGGSAEGFLKNSQRPVVFEFDDAASANVLTNNTDGTQSTKTVAQVVSEKATALNRSIDAAVAIAGGEVKTLQTAVSDPSGAFELAANLFAASVRLPFTILFGQQTGRLASDQDQDDYRARADGRRETELTPMLTEFVERMQACGAIEAGAFAIEWEDLAAPSDDDKVALADKMAGVNQKQSAAGHGAAFSPEEIRRAGGYTEPMQAMDGLPAEGDPGADPAADPAARAGMGGPRPVAAAQTPRLAA